MTDSRIRLFSHLVAYETALWNAIDRQLVESPGCVPLGRLEVLRAIHRGKGMARVQEVSAHLGITVGAASRLVERLVGDELVIRVPHPTDRRSSVLTLSELGLERLNATDEAFHASLHGLLGDGDVETEELADALERAAGRLHAVLEEAPRV